VVDETYEHIVIGAGALGSAAAYWLARSGATKVLVLEQFELGHSRGASEDHSRIIRHSYHSTNYTALTHAMFDTWRELEEESGVKLVHPTGGLDLAVAGSPGEVELANYRASLDAIEVGYEDLTAPEIRRRWPQWRLDDDVVGMFQPDGGILDIRKAGAVHVALARARGVEFAPHTTVRGLSSDDDKVTVVTDRGTLTARNVVVCVASWIEKLLPDLGLSWRMTLTQEQVSYFATPNLRDFAPDRFPIWIWHGEELFYGFPVYGEVAVKLARDMSGRFITVDGRSYEPDPAETALCERFLRERLPGAVGPELLSKTCVYDMPPDRDFILGRVPGQPRLTIGMGAGHAAKFASLIGRILSDITLHDRTDFPIEAFRPDRPALTDPDYPLAFRLVS
jgi:monomeric sarcosine oxidase